MVPSKAHCCSPLGIVQTTTAESVAAATGLRHVCVGDWIKEKKIHGEWDEEFQCFVLDQDGEDKVGESCLLLWLQFFGLHLFYLFYVALHAQNVSLYMSPCTNSVTHCM